MDAFENLMYVIMAAASVGFVLMILAFAGIITIFAVTIVFTVFKNLMIQGGSNVISANHRHRKHRQRRRTHDRRSKQHREDSLFRSRQRWLRGQRADRMGGLRNVGRPGGFFGPSLN
jgi:hypothetical protein